MTFILANGKNRGQRSSKLLLKKSHDNLHSFSYHLHLFGLKTHRRQHPSVYVLFSCFYQSFYFRQCQPWLVKSGYNLLHPLTPSFDIEWYVIPCGAPRAALYALDGLSDASLSTSTGASVAIFFIV